MDKLILVKEELINKVISEMSHLDKVDAKEMGEVIDMIKDIAETIYYCTITEAMEGKYENKHHYESKMYPEWDDTMYYPGNYATKPRMYTEKEWPMPIRDSREGNSHINRKMYMESKEMHEPKATQMKELEKYLHELSSDITEMIHDATPEEKLMLKEKLTGLTSKIV